MASELEITRAGVVGDHLVVRYELHNRTTEPIYVRCLLEDVYGLCGDLRVNGLINPYPLPTPEIAYAMWGGGSRVVLLQGHAVLPPGASVVPPPFALRVMPEGRVRLAIRCRLPLLEWHPDLVPMDEGVTEMTVDQVSLLLECVEERHVTSAAPHEWLSEGWRVGSTEARLATAAFTLDRAVPLLRRNGTVSRVGVDGR